MKKRNALHIQGKRAFFSLDAALAMLLAVLATVSFSAMESSAAASADSSAREISGTNLALRLSNYVVDEAGAATGGAVPGEYVKPGEIDPERLSAIGLQEIVSGAGLKYAKISLPGAQESFPPISAGAEQGEIFCVKRLVTLEKKPALMEVCAA